MYKENALSNFALHIDHYYLNCWLYYYQFLVSLLTFPIIYMIQSRIFKQKNNTADGDDNPFMNLIWHFYEGLSCLTPLIILEYCHGSFHHHIILTNAIILVSIDRLTQL